MAGIGDHFAPEYTAKMVVQEKGGSLITLRHTGGRNISFHLHGKRYEFDPNRIFTDQGIKNTLTQFGPYSREAHQVVKRLANKIISLLPPGKIIAVHNNRSYSLKDYLPGHSYAGEAESIHFHDKAHYRNFYLVTRKQDFNRLKKLNFNEILQSPQPEDDGSLSVYLANRAYINVEAGFDQLKAQIKMLKCA